MGDIDVIEKRHIEDYCFQLMDLDITTAAPEEEESRTKVLLQHIAKNTRLGQGGKFRDDINYHIFFFSNPVEGEPRILHISLSERLAESEKRTIQNRFPGLVIAH